MKLSKYAFGDDGWGEGNICYPTCATSIKQILINLLPYLTTLMLAVGSLLALLLLSPDTLRASPITSSIPLGFEPGAVATDSPNNLIYVVDQGNLQIRVIDGATESLLPNSFAIDSQLSVSRIAVDSARHRLFVNYYCSGCYGYVQVFDIDTQLEISRVENSYGAGGMAINPDNGRVYVAMYWTVWVLYPNDDESDYYLGNTITGFSSITSDVTFDRLHERLYVSIHHTNEVAVVDTSTETLINTVPVLAGNPTTVAVNPNNRHVYVGQNLGNRISVVDGATDTALPNITLSDGPVLVGVDPTTARVFVGMREGMSVGIVDGNTDTVLCPLIPIYGLPTGLSVNTVDHCAYVGVRGQMSIFKVCGCANPSPPTADAGLNISLLSEAVAATTISGIATDPDIGDMLSYSWLEGPVVLLDWTFVGSNGECPLALNQVSLGLGTHTLTLKVLDSNQAVASDDMILTIGNSAPHVAATGAGTYEVNSDVTLAGQVSDFDGDTLSYSWMKGTEVLCTGSVQTVAGGDAVNLPNFLLSSLTIGTHTIVLLVEDGVNQAVKSEVVVKITDDISPTLAPIPNKTILWPPNHKMVSITIQANATDNSGLPAILTASVTSNEPEDGLGDGDIAPDWTESVIDQQAGTITLQLRAERSGKGNGREYSVAITATDLSGNSSFANVKIIVPHDLGNN